jgi:hypothetical protein
MVTSAVVQPLSLLVVRVIRHYLMMMMMDASSAGMWLAAA